MTDSGERDALKDELIPADPVDYLTEYFMISCRPAHWQEPDYRIAAEDLVKGIIDRAALSQDDALPATEHTGMTASWCPICGDCTCPRWQEGDSQERSHLNARNCPLHGFESKHALSAPATDGAEPASVMRDTIRSARVDSTEWGNDAQAEPPEGADTRYSSSAKDSKEAGNRYGKDGVLIEPAPVGEPVAYRYRVKRHNGTVSEWRLTYNAPHPRAREIQPLYTEAHRQRPSVSDTDAISPVDAALRKAFTAQQDALTTLKQKGDDWTKATAIYGLQEAERILSTRPAEGSDTPGGDDG